MEPADMSIASSKEENSLLDTPVRVSRFYLYHWAHAVIIALIIAS